MVNNQSYDFLTSAMTLGKRFLLPIIVFVGLSFTLYLAYKDVRERALQEFNQQQMLMAKQASTGILSFFDNCFRELQVLSMLSDIADFNEEGKAHLDFFLRLHAHEFKAVTRVSTQGVILYTTPEDFIGVSILEQEHVQKAIETKAPVFSDVFRAVQGFKAIALHVPVFSGDQFTGTIGVLFSFEQLAKDHLENIRIGDDGYAWLLSHEGVELYCPVPEHTGRTIFETSERFPTVISMAREMLKGNEGTTAYQYDMVRGKEIEVIKKIASYTPIPLFDTFWSVVVATPETFVLRNVESFRNKIAAISLALLFFTSLYVYYFLRATFLISEMRRRKQFESDREHLQMQLEKAHRLESVGRLAGGIAHDFNNMLSIILGHTEVALDQAGTMEPLASDLKEIQKAAERSADLTRQLLAFARKQPITPQVLNLNGTVEGMLKMLRRLIGEDIELSLVPGECLWDVKIDPSQVDQILANLCINSRDAIAGVGEIVITTSNATLEQENENSFLDDALPGDYVLMELRDSGCGMEPDALTKIFEPFFTTKGVGHGTGLGLSTVYGVVKQNYGYITVHSVVGYGTTFKIYLPRYFDKGDRVQSENPDTQIDCGYETILLVEDEPAILGMTARTLRKLGYSVLTASSPSIAVHLSEEHEGEIHLVVTDIIMPEMNGRDLVKNLLLTRPSLKCLYMSGYTADVIARRGILLPGMNFMQKPFSRQGLAGAVRKALEKEETDIESSELI
jgi:signal transduction histidine kinase/CheY-like chemotaxis protein